MVKVALTSDNHFDINQVDSDEMLKQQAQWLVDNGVKLYLIAGDLFNDFAQSVRYIERLQGELGNALQVRWIAGNHDMLHSVSYPELTHYESPQFMHNRLETIPGTQWCLIGNNGWYDYTLAEKLPEKQDFAQWKQAYWIDSIIDQPMTDEERMEIVLQQTETLLKQARQQRRQVVFMTHFAPRKDYIQVHPELRMWNMSNAMMGSQRLGQLLEAYQVSHVLFGHLHLNVKPRQFEQTTYYNQAVGYHRRRRNEWQRDTFFEQWQQKLEFINLS